MKRGAAKVVRMVLHDSAANKAPCTATMAAHIAHSGHRVAVVTGASRGIGAAVASQLAAAGYCIAAISRSEASAKHAVAALPVLRPEQAHMLIGVDVADAPALEAALARVLAHYRVVHALVNAAGACPAQALRCLAE
jgi:NAD(P)-dependent dehydrogenase (short-subunit alcohol dehydrogenase family)